MALNQSTKIVTDGLVFYYDMSNGKSFVGGPVTNTLPTPAINGLPTFGNGWSTYNTNQYNGNTYFSIGSISSVASNIVTTSGNHPLRSYDVVTPQSSGGGLSAGTNYLVKKLSATTFSLHTWNGSQDGSQGYINPATGTHKVYDDFANDVRIAVNASSFPTMWWGPPHLPNSGLVKEIITNGFNGIVGRMPTDCVRLHFIRPDNVTDGMAYGADAAVTAGVQHTVSFWTRSVTASAVGQYLAYQIYNYGSTTPTGYSFNAVLGPVGVWTKHQMTFTPNNPLAISYWFPSTGSFKCDLSNIQFEVGAVANNFAPGNRAANINLEAAPNFPTWNAAGGSSASGGTLTFGGGSYNSKSVWDLYKTYSGLSTGVNYTWSALVRAGTANNFIVTMNNTSSWNTGPSTVFTGLSSTEWTRVSITGTTNTGSFNLHLGSSANSEVAGTVQNAGTILIQDVSLVLSGNQTSFVDLTGQNIIGANSLTYASNGTFSFNGSSNFMSLSSDVVFKTTGGHTVENWFKLDAVVSGNLYNFIGASSIDYHSWYWCVFQSRLAIWNRDPGGWYYGSTDIQSNVWYQAVMVTNNAGTGIQFYLNGVAEGGTHASYSFNSSYSGLKIGFLGRGDAPNARYMYGLMPVTKVYNRALSAAEVQQNFNALRSRYGI